MTDSTTDASFRALIDEGTRVCVPEHGSLQRIRAWLRAWTVRERDETNDLVAEW